ncbi:peptidase S8/S53 domain-containing protein [Auriculariales sp. MPI-PUGE-AT-0066]|nr:peptidase S8/S53 domain-containing protein [Auriculariales sp. MPI-PUGE-AT-0066]
MLVASGLVALAAFGPLLSSATRTPVKRDYAASDYYVVEHDPASPVSIQELASALGVNVVEQAGELNDHYLLSTPKHTLRSRSEDDRVLNRLRELRRLARRDSSAGRLDSRALDSVHHAKRVVDSVLFIERQALRQRIKRDDSHLQPHSIAHPPLAARAPPPIPPPATDDSKIPKLAAVVEKFHIKDPIFGDQWHLVNDDMPRNMMNVTPAWAAGVTGKGVIVAMVDDGVDFTSDDLAANYDAAGSYDFNDHDPFPQPVLFDDHHGTRCAGEIAAGKNDVCGVGIAYESKIAGLRILSAPVTDVDEAAALNYGFQNTSIYSCSWGPPDDGRSMEGPSYLNRKAMLNGVQNGRGGKGSIFVFASGNGASSGDQCNFDGYTNSIFSVTVAAVDYKGLHPYYSEACAANMVVTYSSGGGRSIHTTDVGKNTCSTSHGGTSAAAPLASAVFALALQIRPDLTWRDVQHLCVRAAVRINPEDPDWETTAAGRPYSYKYGYGVLDAGLYVEAARNWKVVKPQAYLELPTVELANGDMTADGKMTGGEPIVAGGVRNSVEVTSDKLKAANFETLEHVTVKVWISHPRRGDVQVEVTSPGGVKSILAGTRKYDEDKNGFVGWQFSTVKHWDENPVGNWTIRVSDQEQPDRKGFFLGWEMTLWGSAIDPAKATPWKLPRPTAGDDAEEATTTTTTSTVTAQETKQHPKPTEGLPSDAHEAPGEAHKPAFDVKISTTVSTSATSTGTPAVDEGYFSGMGGLLKSQTWVFVSLGVVAIFALLAGLFLWRRRAAQRRARAQYGRVAEEEDIGMRSVRRGGQGTKELYDAFGEVDDDEEDADENMRLTGAREHTPLGFHDGFLNDDDPASARSPHPTVYRDNPLREESSRHLSAETSELPPREEAPSPASGSGDGSWELEGDARSR